MININTLKKLSSNNSNDNNENIKKIYYHIFDNVNKLNENPNLSFFNNNLNKGVFNNKLEQIDTKNLEYFQNDFINKFEEYNNNHVEVDVIIDEKNSYFKLADLYNEGNIPGELSKVLYKYLPDVNFYHLGVNEENSIFYALLFLLDKSFIFKTNKDTIITELKNKLLLEISGDKLFSFFKMYKLKTNLDKIHNEFNKNIISESVIVLLEKYFDVNFLIYDVFNKNFIEREIYKMSNFYILLKYKNSYFPVCNKQNIVLNINDHKDFLFTIKTIKELNNPEEKVKKENNKNLNDLSKLKKDELIKLCEEKNIDYEYIDDKTKKIKTFNKPELIKKLSNI